MENLFKDSIILSSVYRFLLFIYTKFQESYIYKFFNYLSKKFNYFLSYSKFWTYFKESDYLDKLLEKSFIINIINFLINLPIKITRLLYIKFKNFIDVSLTHKVMQFLSENITILIGLVLTFTMIVPDSKWYNIYSVIMTFGLLLVFIYKATINQSISLDIKKLDISFLIFISVILISGFMSIFFKDSLNDLIFYILILITMIILFNSINSSKDLSKLVHFIVIATSITAFYGLYQWKVVGIEINPSLTDITVNQGMGGRVYSTMGNPNIYGELLVLTMPFFIAAILNSKKYYIKLLYSGLYLMTLVILLKTGSRSAWVAFAFSWGTFIFFKDKRLLPIFLLLGMFLIPFLPSSIYNRLLTIVNPNDSSLKYRKAILEPAMPMLRDYWFTGVGLGSKTFNAIYKRYKDFTLKTVAHSHNLFLQIWLESGIVALLSFLWLGFRMVKKTSYIKKNSSEIELINISIAAMSAIAGIVIMGFADHIWFYNRILYVFWLVASIVFISYNITKKIKL